MEGSHSGGSLRQSRETNVSTLPACYSTHMTKELTSHPEKFGRAGTMKDVACWLAGVALMLSYLSYTAWDLLPRGKVLPKIDHQTRKFPINQGKSPETCPLVNLMLATPQLRFCSPEVLGCVKLAFKVHHNTVKACVGWPPPQHSRHSHIL